MIPPSLPQYLTVDEVAQILRVTPATVRNMIKDNRIDAIQPSGHRGSYRVPLSALDNLMGSPDRSQAPVRETRSIHVSPSKN